VARAEHADGSKKAQAMSQAGATDAQPFGQFAFGRQSIAGLKTALTDHFANLDDDLFGYQSAFFWSDHPKSAKTNRAALVSCHFSTEPAVVKMSASHCSPFSLRYKTD
jgi:hypothetical protein